MSKPCRRPSRAELKEQRSHKRQQEKALREQQRRDGLLPRTPPPLPNTTSTCASIAEEQQAREAAVSGQIRVLRRELPALLERLGQIPNPRHPNKCRHQLTVLLLYGLLMFVFQFAHAVRGQPRDDPPPVRGQPQAPVPRTGDPAACRHPVSVLRDIDVAHLEQAHVDLVRRLIRAKTFRRYLINHAYPIAIDGSQKFARDTLWDENPLQRTLGQAEQQHTQYFVYVLEASLSFQNGLVIPLLSEFLAYAKGDTDANKQDCEQRAFMRLRNPTPLRIPITVGGDRVPMASLVWQTGPVAQTDRAPWSGSGPRGSWPQCLARAARLDGRRRGLRRDGVGAAPGLPCGVARTAGGTFRTVDGVQTCGIIGALTTGGPPPCNDRRTHAESTGAPLGADAAPATGRRDPRGADQRTRGPAAGGLRRGDAGSARGAGSET